MPEARHGWGYLGNMVGAAQGAVGSIQTKVDSTTLGGDTSFTYDGSKVSIGGELVVAGQTFAYGSPTIISSGTFNIPEHGRVVMYTDDDCKVTISDGATLKIADGAKVKFKDFATI